MEGLVDFSTFRTYLNHVIVIFRTRVVFRVHPTNLALVTEQARYIADAKVNHYDWEDQSKYNA